MRKFGLVLVVLMLFGVGKVFAQQHYVAAELSLLGLGVRYEFQLNPHFSLGARAYVAGGFFSTSYSIYATASFYPWAGNFFVGANAGFRLRQFFPDTQFETNFGGFVFAPEIGWRIDAGTPGGFYVQPGIRIPLHFIGQQDISPDNPDTVESFIPGFTLYIGFGWMF